MLVPLLLLGAGLVRSSPLTETEVPNVVLPATPATLSGAQTADLDALLRRAPRFPVRVGLLVTDADSGRVLYTRDADAAFPPASNMKLLSLTSLLSVLGPDYWFSTSVTRPRSAASAQATHLTLVGLGDPSLEQSSGEHSLAGLARQVYAHGLRSVTDIRLDAHLIGASAGHTQNGTAIPGWTLPLVERPVVGLTLNDPSVGEGAELTAHPDAQAALLRVGREFRAELQRAGVQVTGKVELAPPAAPPEEGIATTRSAPLLQLARYALKRSDNVWAEQLYARLGVNSQTPVWRAASLEEASAQERAFLKRAGATAAELQALSLRDGSGLSEDNRLTPAVLVRLLRYVYQHPFGSDLLPGAAFRARQNPLIEALPRAGTGSATRAARELGGTLAERLKGLDVRAKTGTLPGVSSLSGYLTARSGRVLIFSMLMDGYPGPIQNLRQLQDALLSVLAADPSN
ncbi:D-alanyl-D-alanine carboxypeptidase [Deinococcus sp. KNUC1210]|uniref:D-alanyl-D-alanine carboxypeptidase/D-alanyl-D-alanine-endopeptidase n=1 Tax=Deinococcus sp. KNUC1210 TaxID=2917691 RepID=UPI001EEFB74B|nr:D-alanyl-D-alanine carboxypeptidase [Deinococcus sp. KNUC1210]ULH14656.1 D-alanyl-D-alanine carboxypeptidase [Deinococcus sp. KNUC1210]